VGGASGADVSAKRVRGNGICVEAPLDARVQRPDGNGTERGALFKRLGQAPRGRVFDGCILNVYLQKAPV
jgi:hypothetical protein